MGWQTLDSGVAALLGALIGGAASVLGTIAAHWLASRHELRMKTRTLLLERYQVGRKALDDYIDYAYEPPTGVASNGRGEDEHLIERLAELFGPKFAAKAVGELFKQSADIGACIEAMRNQLEKWEREIGFPPREELSKD